MIKPIIIDGVDVSGCKDYFAQGCYMDEISPEDCEGKNCIFKQLARKTEECEKLKDALKNVQDFINAGINPKQTETETASLNAFYTAIELIEEVLK
ncbi:MAG: hypothetical protein NC191_09980 [Muribaculaceae bacterium]|nr:hypothetical protein [Muribaculaceae bacterium]